MGHERQTFRLFRKDSGTAKYPIVEFWLLLTLVKTNAAADLGCLNHNRYVIVQAIINISTKTQKLFKNNSIIIKITNVRKKSEK